MTQWAAFVFDPGSMAAWALVGVAVGFLVCQLKDAASYGVIGDLIFGSVGGVAAGVLFSFFGAGSPSFWTSTLVALVGACVLIAGARVITARMNA